MSSGAGASPDPVAFERLKALIDRLVADLDVLSYYQLLGVRPGATVETIKQAYYGRAQQLHPDRYLMVQDHGFRELLGQLWKAIAEAYRVLSSDHERVAYDARSKARESAASTSPIASAAPTPTAAGPASSGSEDIVDGRAREYFDYGMRAFQRADFKNAIALLEQALSREPGAAVILRSLEEVRRTKGLWGE